MEKLMVCCTASGRELHLGGFEETVYQIAIDIINNGYKLYDQ